MTPLLLPPPEASHRAAHGAAAHSASTPLRRLLGVLLAVALTLTAFAVTPVIRASAAPLFLEDFKPATYNMQGRDGGAATKWTTDIQRLMANHDVVALQEAGPQPPASATFQQTYTPDPSLPAISEYSWNLGSRSRPNIYWIYFMITDPGANRVNLAMVTQTRAARVFAINPGIPATQTSEGSRPAFGVRLGSTIFYTLHGLSGNGNDDPNLVAYMAGQAAAYSLDFAALGDYNRDPDSLRTRLPGGSYIHSPAGVTRPSPAGGSILDYLVTSRVVPKGWGARTLTNVGSDHLAVDFTQMKGGAPQVGSFCSDEGNPCTITAGSTVIFGTGNFYDIYKNFPGPPPGGGAASLACNIATFGSDPAPGTTKHCWVQYTHQQWTDTTQTISNVNNQCLGPKNGASVDGTTIVPSVCTGVASQAWQFPTDSTIRTLGKCLTESTANPSLVVLSTCQDPPTDGQQWFANPDGGTLTTTYATAFCLTIAQGRLGFFTCNGLSTQSFRFPSNSIAFTGSLAGLCLQQNDGAVNTAEPCTGIGAQSWQFGPGNTVRIRRYNKGCLGITPGTDTPSAQRCDGGPDRKVEWLPQADGRLKNVSTGTCLGIKTGTRTIGLSACGSSPSQVLDWPRGQAFIMQGTTLKAGDSLYSASTRLTMQSDGNLVLYSLASGKSLWASGTHGSSAKALMHDEGTLCVYADSTWCAPVEERGAWAALTDDGNLVIYRERGTDEPLWSATAVHLEVLGLSGALYSQTFDSSGDSFDQTWTAVDNEQRRGSRSVATVAMPGMVRVYATANDNRIWYYDLNTTTNQWSGWSKFPGDWQAVDLTAAQINGIIYLEMVGIDGEVFSLVSDSNGVFGPNADWRDVGAKATQVTSVAVNDNIEVFTIDTRGQVQVLDLTTATGKWTASQVPGNLAGAKSLTASYTHDNGDFVHLLAETGGGTLWEQDRYAEYEHVGFFRDSWIQHPSLAHNLSKLASVETPGVLHLYGIGDGGLMYHRDLKLTGTWGTQEIVPGNGAAIDIGLSVNSYSM
ncbi:ricin-type beta-trefoil lectin domain protein [Kitasatospora sp. MBT63]|uniref:ricin-type beta-trefoil lectin domain protein n=1 Tax=Kitasatospora sp. MBT63 TaxID=1444768 RepID=UPI00053A62ED|nr:ricin-type beta-trefoil lectin domain protein [Kitasatospora sp. MBT63]